MITNNFTNYPRIASKLLSEPWCIRPEVHASIVEQFQNHVKGAADSFVGEEGFAEHPQVEVIGNVAILPIQGIISKHCSDLEIWCGACDLEIVRKQISNIENDPMIKHCVVYFDTPGGACTGVAETAAMLASMTKNVIGYTSQQCCSAGYWLASACDSFYCASDSYIGSISTYLALMDTSKNWEEAGVERVLVATGTYKALGISGAPITPEQRAYLAETVNQVDSEFKGFVKDRRNLTDEQMQGQVWDGKNAPSTLHDGLIASIEELIAAL